MGADRRERIRRQLERELAAVEARLATYDQARYQTERAAKAARSRLEHHAVRLRKMLACVERGIPIWKYPEVEFAGGGQYEGSS